MSKTCGDMARFNRVRKRNIARRMMVRQLREKLVLAAAATAKTATTSTPGTEKA